jgi:selenocysteine lyase/cysteine desulfurase
VVIAGEQFPSNVYPWMSATEEQGGELIIVEPPIAYENRGKKWNEDILNAINENTAVVAISHAHWADGTRFDLKAIRNATNEVGALLIIDGTQSIGAFPFDLEDIKPDALICAGYKWMLGPYGIGMAYYGEYFDDGKPIEENWINRLHSEDFAGLVEYESQYQPGALKYEVGEHSNFILVPMMLEALKQINDWEPGRIQSYCEKITREPLERLRESGFWVEEPGYRTAHLFGIRHKEMPLNKVKEALSERKVYVSYRGSSIRVAPYIHNTKEDIDVLVDTLIECI